MRPTTASLRELLRGRLRFEERSYHASQQADGTAASARSCDDEPFRQNAIIAGRPPLSSGGQAPLPPMQAGYAFPTSDCWRSSMRIVTPRNVQVVLADEPGTPSELQRRKGHVRRGRRQFPRAVPGGAKAELIEVAAFPTHRDLEHAVQLAQGTRGQSVGCYLNNAKSEHSGNWLRFVCLSARSCKRERR
jgi:hypothetical protein